MPYATLSIFILFLFSYLMFTFFLHVLICIFVIVAFCVCILICTYLYFCVLLFVFSVICMHQGVRVTQFQFSVCMYGTCGRIDNKADFDFDF